MRSRAYCSGDNRISNRYHEVSPKTTRQDGLLIVSQKRDINQLDRIRRARLYGDRNARMSGCRWCSGNMIIILLPAQLREGQSATVASPSALTKTYNNSRGILLPQGCEASRVTKTWAGVPM
ncbi:hypothetical protein AcW1_002317 [Taiwanofungus camphoratus]|nr:hypothetical protein AcV5_010317 [Antrodia cinnamomea]KAI0944655.1 hypothetical protein AcW1_002317 [Antrodia cinnamomea]